MNLEDFYFVLVCLASVLVLAVILNYFMDLLDKDGKDE